MVPSPSSSASARIVESSDAELRAILLKLSDLPSGRNQDAASSIGLDSSCAAISDPAYGSTAEVDAAWTGYVRAMASCGHITIQLAGRTVQSNLLPMPMLRTGNAMDARQAVTTAQGRTASFCFVVIRTGNLLDALTYSDWGTPNTSEVERFASGATLATDRIR